MLLIKKKKQRHCNSYTAMWRYYNIVCPWYVIIQGDLWVKDLPLYAF